MKFTLCGHFAFISWWFSNFSFYRYGIAFTKQKCSFCFSNNITDHEYVILRLVHAMRTGKIRIIPHGRFKGSKANFCRPVRVKKWKKNTGKIEMFYPFLVIFDYSHSIITFPLLIDHWLQHFITLISAVETFFLGSAFNWSHNSLNSWRNAKSLIFASRKTFGGREKRAFNEVFLFHLKDNDLRLNLIWIVIYQAKFKSEQKFKRNNFL